MSSRLKILIFIFLISLSAVIRLEGQETVIKGVVCDSAGIPIPLVNISISGLSAGTFSDNQGAFILVIGTDSREHPIEFSSIGYETTQKNIIAAGDTIQLNIILTEKITSLSDVIVRESLVREEPTLKRVPIKSLFTVPAPGGYIETIIKTFPGVSSGNELSNQYSVRGGSYDENLVYLNDIEIYRPVLIHSGKQEGMSIINPDMVGSIEFSTGGFNASYGDKMASVLDIRYREANSFKGSVSAGLLTSTAHLEGTGLNDRLRFTTGVRYKTNRLLLGTLDTRANYSPAYFDLQTLISYRAGNITKISLLATQNINSYSFTPISQKSSFGNIAEAYQLYVRYEGSEKDVYYNNNLALSVEITPVAGFVNRFTLHRYSATESETFDIRGTYSLNLLDKDTGSENLGDSIMNIGTGSWLDHARNYLDANVMMAGFRSRWEHVDNVLSWGVKLKYEKIDDNLREWRRIDSAGYTLPYSTTELRLSEFASSVNSITTRRVETFLIDNYTFRTAGHSIIFTGGIRLSYWSFNDELLVSPRFSVYWQPANENITFYSSYGTYYQPPFYREMRGPDGILNNFVRSQKSIHYVAGSTFDFTVGETPLRLTGEIYFKQFTDLIPYKFDNVRVIYSGENSAIGEAMGIDLRLNGEFVNNAESWISMSVMKSYHDIIGDGMPRYPAPADVRFSSTIFFQDYLPSNPTLRAHINIQFSTGVPVSSPYSERYDSFYRMPSYRRVDLGFSKLFIRQQNGKNSSLPGWIDSIVAGIEIFNLLDINNTISYNWLTTVNNLDGEVRQFAVPNYLTGRSLNFRMTVSF